MFKAQSYGDRHKDRPVIIFSDIKLIDLLAVLNYVYKGEVQIPENNLNSFVNAVLTLQIKGFMADGSTQQLSESTAATAITTTQREEPKSQAGTPTKTMPSESVNVSTETSEIITEDVFFGTPLDGGSQLLPLSSTSGVNCSDLAQSSSSYLEYNKSDLSSTSESKTGSFGTSTDANKPSGQSGAGGTSQTRRSRKRPAYLQSFHLDSDNNEKLTLKCKFCGKGIQGSSFGMDEKQKSHEAKCVSNPKRDQSFANCPICEKVVSKNYIEIHIRKIHGAKKGVRTSIP